MNNSKMVKRVRSLLICSNENELQWLKQYARNEYSIGTINYAFYMRCRDSNEDVVMLEYDGEIPNEETWDMLKKINAVIESCKVERTYLYNISYHIEGGVPYHIASIITYINLLEMVMKAKQIREVLMVDNKENWIINEAIFLFCYNKQIQYSIFDSTNGMKKTYLFTLRNSKYGERNHNEEYAAQIEKVQEYYKKKRKKAERKKNIYDIGCIYPARNNAKHFSWLLDEMELFKENYSIQIMCFFDSDDIRRLEENGYEVDCVENYFEGHSFWNDVVEYFRDISEIEARLETELIIFYKGIDMKDFICRKVINYLQRESLELLYIDHCLREYFKSHKYGLIRAWGTANFWQTRIVHANAKSSKFYIFWLNVVTYPEFYEPYKNILDIIIYSNKTMRDFYTDKEYKGIAYAGYDLRNCETLYRNLLNNKEQKMDKLKILVALPFPFLGQLTYKSFGNVFHVILEELSKEGCDIVIKNHPNMDDDIEYRIYELYRGKQNVTIVEKGKSIKEALETCDIVITGISNVIFDAGIAQKVVYCIIDEWQHDMMKHLEQGIKVFFNVKKMCKDIRRLVDKRDKSEIKEIIDKQNEFLKEQFGNYTEETRREILEIFSRELADL